MTPRTTLPLLLLMLAAARVFAAAPDYAREKRWADEVSPTVVVGDAVSLPGEGKRPFLALYAEGKPDRPAVILVHGAGIHPDHSFIGALRSELSERGYATLSLQMPVLAAEVPPADYPALFPIARERIAAGVAFLRDRSASRIAVVSHSMGARMSNDWLATPGAQINGWVAIGISNGVFAPVSGSFPILDLYAERDFDIVLARAPERRAAISARRGSGQIMVPATDHYFGGRYREAVAAIDVFLRALR